MSDQEPLEKNTTVGVPLDPGLREKLKAAAKADGRSEAGFIRFNLENLLADGEDAK